MSNKLYFGDNLDIMRECMDSQSVDLVYLDPPFNSKAQYNVLFDPHGNEKNNAQAGAFVDSWSWGDESEWCMAEIMRSGGKTARLLDALRSALGETDLMAYLAMMTPRLIEMRRILTDTGSLYLHCDSAASHYLKVVLDSIFLGKNFRNEVIWKRTSAHSDAKRFGRVHDVILYFSCSDDFTWNAQFQPYSEDYIEKRFKHKDPDGRRYMDDNLTAKGLSGGGYEYEYKGKSSLWRVPLEKMKRLDAENKLYYTRNGGIRIKRYLDEMDGLPASDVWTDIHPINSQSKERIGYPTQKPRVLLDRIIAASSNKGDIVFDPFCGCGTTIEASQELNRGWVGIDVAIHAIKVIEARIEDRIEGNISYEIEGIPRDFQSAIKLAEKDKYQFQWWANYLFNPHALREQKKGADRGVDGELFFPNGPGRPYGRVLTSVKGGERVGPAMVRDFRGVLEREKAEMGLFICLREPSREMAREASAAGIADTVHGDLPRLQIVSIEQFFEGKLPALPPLNSLPSAAYSTAKRRSSKKSKKKKPDPKAPEFMFEFPSVPQAAEGTVRHINPHRVAKAV